MSDAPLNLIIITSDQMRGDAPAFMGNPDCKTPNLDRFAKKGIVFSKHFTVHGKCVPSRIAIDTGRYSHTDGFRCIFEDNHLPPGSPDLLESLKNAGYESAYFGHNHIWQEFWGDNIKGQGKVDYHSFTKDYFQHMLEKEWPVEQPGLDSVKPMEMNDGFDYEGRTEGPLTGFRDDNRTAQAIHYLTKVRDRSRPFYMQLNFGKPHTPYTVEEPYFSMYDRQALQALPHDLPENAPLPIQKMREVRTGLDATDAELREIQAVYYGMVTKVDVLFGKLLDVIESEALFENTVILFTTDHGDFAGQYGLSEKWDTAMQDCIMHVPFVLWAPGLSGGRRIEDSMSEHVDIAPTIIDLLGLKKNPKWGIHGESLVPVIRGEKTKDIVFADGGHEQEMIERFNAKLHRERKGRTIRATAGKQQTYHDFPETMARTCMARTDRWKLVVRLKGGNELYDMQNDPHEMQNLWGRHEQDADLKNVVAELMMKIIEWRLRTDTDRPWQENVGA
ncbi:MAG: sulfatase-like hydrolase/transferase [Candidatus Sumerlaeia bacterium]